MVEQQMAELAVYEKQYGKVGKLIILFSSNLAIRRYITASFSFKQYGHLVARWHRDSDIIHNRMTVLEHTKWARMRRRAAPEEVSGVHT